MTVTPFPTPALQLDRCALLSTCETFLNRYVVLSPHQSTAVTLFIAHTHAIDASDCTPYLSITSKEKRSGKTRLLEVLELLVCRALRSSDFTEAALFHMIPHQPTLLLDEIDTVFRGPKSREPLRALLNAGYRRGSPVRRVKGSTVEAFDPFCAKVIAGIGTLPDTVADRSIPIRLARKEPTQSVERFRMRDVTDEGKVIRDQMFAAFGRDTDNARWLSELANVRPELPGWLNDRQQDSWEPLLAIAQMVGGEWSERARAASYQLHQAGGGAGLDT